MSYNEFIIVFFAGSIGSLTRLLVDSGCVILPKKIDGTLVLGFLGSMFIGGVVGVLVDGDFISAALAGYIGVDIFDRLVPSFNTNKLINVVNDIENK